MNALSTSPQTREITRKALDGQLLVTATTPPAAGSFTVTHGLGRVPSGYVLVRSDGYVQLHEDLAVPPTEDDLTLVADTASVTVTLLVF